MTSIRMRIYAGFAEPSPDKYLASIASTFLKRL
jgi:hypothetical protein